MAVRLSDQQRMWLSKAYGDQCLLRAREQTLAESVKGSLEVGVPLNTLATALGVSRSRVRRLARVEKSE